MRRAILLALMACLLAGPVHADDRDFFGIWDVNTYLTAASNPVNRDYEPGDVRADVWRIDGTALQSTLTTRDGTMPGQIANGQAEYYAEVPVGQIVLMRIMIAASLTSSRSMKGTIRAEYWDRRFGTQIGLDAWTFEGLRR